MAPLFFIRHGETNWNAEGRLQGQTEQPLNERGEAQARQVGRTLAKLLQNRFELPFIASPMLRTRQTMELMRATLGLAPDDYSLDRRLIEITFGRWEGLLWSDVAKRDPDGAKEREVDKWNAVPPNGESYAMLSQRVRPFIETVERPSVIVSHGGVARIFMVVLSGLDPVAAASAEVRQGAVLLFENGRHRWVG
jgi:broad specificity phosphatase PhoE